MSCIFGENRDIFFPKLSAELNLTSFSDIAIKYLKNLGFESYLCKDEDEARELAKILPPEGKYPCLFTSSDTTGEKDFEEFFTDSELLDMERFEHIGIIKNDSDFNDTLLEEFEESIQKMLNNRAWKKEQIVELFFKMIPDFGHKETGKYLEGKM
jgi:hypothetical protein